MKINQWSKEKPDKPCIFLAKYPSGEKYVVYESEIVDMSDDPQEYNLQLAYGRHDEDFDKEDSDFLCNLEADEYMILDVKDGIVKKRFIPMIEIQKYFCSMQEYYQKEYDFWMIRAINSVKQHARHIKVEHLVQHQNTLVKLTAKLELMQDIINRFDNFKSIESEVEDE